jgi:hypothetical protein
VRILLPWRRRVKVYRCALVVRQALRLAQPPVSERLRMEPGRRLLGLCRALGWCSMPPIPNISAYHAHSEEEMPCDVLYTHS